MTVQRLGHRKCPAQGPDKNLDHAIRQLERLNVLQLGLKASIDNNTIAVEVLLAVEALSR